MADEASETFSGGTRNFLGALGFILPLVGVEELVRWWQTGDHTVPTLPWWASLTLIVVGLPIYWLPASVKALRNKLGKSTQSEKLQYLSNEDSELSYAIKQMVWRSAWARWYAAQVLATNNHRPADESHMMTTATFLVREALLDGTLEGRGRRPGQLDYEVIPRTHWRSSVPHMIPDARSLWRMILIPTGGAQIGPDGSIIASDPVSEQRNNQLAAFDSIIINSRQFESLWPRQHKQTDKARKRLLKTAKKAGADPAEIKKLARE